MPGRPASSPIRMIWAFPASGEPGGLSRASVSFETVGRLPPLLRIVGMPSGCAISRPAAITPCQLAESTTATACGRLEGPVEGKTALTAPATSAAASPPGTRVVFLVADTGKPSSVAADLSVDLALICGALPLWVLLFSFRPAQPATASRQARRAATSGRRIGQSTITTRMCGTLQRYDVVG